MAYVTGIAATKVVIWAFGLHHGLKGALCVLLGLIRLGLAVGLAARKFQCVQCDDADPLRMSVDQRRITAAEIAVRPTRPLPGGTKQTA
jgi:hypothetical protein